MIIGKGEECSLGTGGGTEGFLMEGVADSCHKVVGNQVAADFDALHKAEDEDNNPAGAVLGRVPVHMDPILQVAAPFLLPFHLQIQLALTIHCLRYSTCDSFS